MTEHPKVVETKSARRRWPRSTFLAAAALVLAFLWQDRGSVEHGNRLYRSGDATTAAAIYHGVTGAEEPTPLPHYNLGTALLALDPDSAEAPLQAATEAADREIAQRGFYNLGLRFLTRAGTSMVPDSAANALFAAVANGRQALRLDPTDQDARWNLALAQRRLDALVPPEEQAQRESAGEGADEIAMEDESLSRTDNADAVSGLEPEDPRPADNTGERQGAQEGAREAWASQDPGPLTRDAAVGLLGMVQDEPETLIRGILWSHRPDIAWWESQPYPGGGW